MVSSTLFRPLSAGALHDEQLCVSARSRISEVDARASPTAKTRGLDDGCLESTSENSDAGVAFSVANNFNDWVSARLSF